jgi:hypothetical protein
MIRHWKTSRVSCPGEDSRYGYVIEDIGRTIYQSLELNISLMKTTKDQFLSIAPP